MNRLQRPDGVTLAFEVHNTHAANMDQPETFDAAVHELLEQL